MKSEPINRISFGLGLGIVFLLPAGVFSDNHAASAARPIHRVVGVLDYSKPLGTDIQDDEEDLAADNFFAALDERHGEVIDLQLTIVPQQHRERLGYRLVPIQDTWGQRLARDPNAEILCGSLGENTVLGIIDNFSSVHELAVGHTRHSHADVTLTIGDRARFPFQSIICSSDLYTEQDYTNLVIEGRFVVNVATIPTVVTYRLYPYPEISGGTGEKGADSRAQREQEQREER